MPLVLPHTAPVRQTLKAPGSLLADVTFLAFVGGIVGLLVMMAQHASQRLEENVDIDIWQWWALPKYTAMSLFRGFAAYLLSLAFTLVYATFAAHHRRAEKIMVSALDVLQSIPVLSFLPTVVLAMIALFPTREIGLEFACVVMIFTGQAWNMTFSMYGSIKSLPMPLREAAQVYQLGWWRVFRLLELPASMIGLVWNSMMSMAGGWFVLTLSEAFTLKGKSYRLPGIGSYMAKSIDDFDPGNLISWIPICGAVVAMVLMIVAVDQLFWRPIVVWSERFKMEETAEAEKPKSWALDLLLHSKIYVQLRNWWRRRGQARDRISAPARAARVAATLAIPSGAATTPGPSGNGELTLPPTTASSTTGPSTEGPSTTGAQPPWSRVVHFAQRYPRRVAAVKAACTWALAIALIGGSALGIWSLAKLWVGLPWRDPLLPPAAMLRDFHDALFLKADPKLDDAQSKSVEALFADAGPKFEAAIKEAGGNEDTARKNADGVIDDLTDAIGKATDSSGKMKLLTSDQQDQLLKIRDDVHHDRDWLHVLSALGASFLRVIASILIGAVWTLPVGILIGLSPKWSQRLQPVVQVVASFPANILFPLMTIFLVAIHFPFTVGCISLMLLGTQWYILFNVIAGAMAIPGDLKEVQNVFGTGWVKRWTRLYIPCVFPFLVTGLVTAAGGAWNVTIVAEYVTFGHGDGARTYTAFGIGSIISLATNAGNFNLLAAATVSLAVFVVLLNRVLWKRLYRVAEQRYSLNV